MTKNEIEDAILVARRIALSGAAGSPVDAELMARALLAITGSIRAAPEWVEPADLWLNRFRVWRDKGFWLADWGPAPTDDGFQGPKQLLTDFLEGERREEIAAPEAKEAAAAEATAKPKELSPKAEPAGRCRRRKNVGAPERRRPPAKHPPVSATAHPKNPPRPVGGERGDKTERKRE